jgi:hypothetical protein
MAIEAPMVERRNLELRARRDAIAGWFGVHPYELATVAVDVLEVMHRRIESLDRRVA